MKVTAERIPESQVVLDVELDDERVERALNQAARRLSQRFLIPGFRKGKAPRQVVERVLSVDAVFEEATERLVPQALQEAIEGEGLEPIALPQVEITGREPMTFRATVPLEPTVELGDYRSIAVARPDSEYTEELVDEQILALRRRHAVLEPVERAPEMNDRVTADIRATVDDNEVLNEEAAEFHLREGQAVGVPGLMERLVGLEVGVEHEIEIDVDEDWDDEEVAGKTVTFRATIHDVKHEELPDPDDDFAMEVSDEFETFAELRGRIEEQLREQTDRQAADLLRRSVLEAVIAKSTLEYPPALVEHEVEHMRQDFARQMGQDPATFLQGSGEQGEQLLASFRSQANERVINTLLLQRISEAEALTVLDEEIEAELRTILDESMDAGGEDLLEDEQVRENVRQRLVRERTIERLEQIAIANEAAGLGADDEAAEDADEDRDITIDPEASVESDDTDEADEALAGAAEESAEGATDDDPEADSADAADESAETPEA